MTETNAERLKRAVKTLRSLEEAVDAEWGLSDSDFEDIAFIIEQIEQTQELQRVNESLSEESRSNFQSASDFKKENARLRRILKDIRDVTTGSPHEWAKKGLEGSK